jgi:hypothetical protein
LVRNNLRWPFLFSLQYREVASKRTASFSLASPFIWLATIFFCDSKRIKIFYDCFLLTSQVRRWVPGPLKFSIFILSCGVCMKQGCQIVFFIIKIPIFDAVWNVLQWKI